MSDARDSVKVQDSEVSVDSTAGGTQILAANNERRFILISNEGSAAVWVRFGADPASTTTGHKIASGDNLLIDKRPPQSEIKAITDSGSTTIFATEGT